MVLMLTTGVTGVLGQSAGSAVTLSNIRRLVVEPQPPTMQPANVMSQVTPIDFHRPHKWLKGEIHCTSEAYDAFYANGGTNHSGGTAYIKPNGENVAIPYAVFSGKDVQGKIWTWTFTGFIPCDDPGEFEVDKEVVRVYPFVAQYVTPTPGT